MLWKLGGGLLWFPLSYVLVQIGGKHTWVAALVALGALGGCVYLVLTRFTVAGRRTFAEGVAVDWAGTSALLMQLVALCTAGFAALSIWAYELGAGTIKDGPLGGRELVDASYAYFLWHFADTIPLFDVPKTLNWKLKHPFTDTFQGSLALVYTVLVVLPLVYAATQVLRRWTSDPLPRT